MFTGIWSQDMSNQTAYTDNSAGTLCGGGIAAFYESLSYLSNVSHDAEQSMSVMPSYVYSGVTPTSDSYQRPLGKPFAQELTMKPPPPGPSSQPSILIHLSQDHTLTFLPVPETKRWFTPYIIPGTEKCLFKCQISGCDAQPFKNKSKAQAHVYKHLHAKLVECSCGKKFSFHGTAKRHVNSQWNKYPCAFCPKQFTRMNARNVHQGRHALAGNS